MLVHQRAREPVRSKEVEGIAGRSKATGTRVKSKRPVDRMQKHTSISDVFRCGRATGKSQVEICNIADGRWRQ